MQSTAGTIDLLERIWARPMAVGGQHEEDVFRDVLREDPKLGERIFGVPTRYLNSTPPHGGGWDAEDFVLHFLSVQGDRTEMLRDAIAMGEARRRG